MPVGEGLAPPEKTNGSTKALPYGYGGNLHQAVGVDAFDEPKPLAFPCQGRWQPKADGRVVLNVN